MLLKRTGVEITYLIIIVVMKFVPCVNNEFVPLAPMTANEQPNNTTVKYSELASTPSIEDRDNNLYSRITSLNKTKYFLKTIKLTTCTPFFIRRLYRTKTQPKDDFSFYNSDFTSKQPSTKMVENTTNETFKPHRGKIGKFFFHKTIEPNTEIIYSNGTQYLGTNNNYSEPNISMSRKRTTNEYDQHYKIFNNTITTGSNSKSAVENDTTKNNVPCIASSRCQSADTTVASADFTDSKKQSVIYLTKLINFKTNARNKPRTKLKTYHPPQLINKMLKFTHKKLNDSHELKQFNNIINTFTTMDETVSRTKVTPNFKINDLHDTENKNLELITTFSPYTKILLKNVLNFNDPSKPKSSTKKYNPIQFIQNSPSKNYKNKMIISSSNSSVSNGDCAKQNNYNYYSRPFDETPTLNCVTRIMKYCADSVFQTPRSLHQEGIFIIPPPNIPNVNMVVNYTNSNQRQPTPSTLPSKRNEQNGNNISRSGSVSHKVNLKSPNCKVNENTTVQSKNIESCRDIIETTRTTPYGDALKFNFKNIVNFKRRTTKFNELLVKTILFYTTRHPYTYGTTTSNRFPPVGYTVLNNKLSHPSFTHVSTDRDQESQKSQIKYHSSVSKCTTDTNNLLNTPVDQLKANSYSTEFNKNVCFETGNSVNINTVVTLATRTYSKLNLFNFKKPTSKFSQSDSAACTTETQNNVINNVSNKENNTKYCKEKQSQSQVDITVPSNFNIKNLFNKKKNSNIMSEYYIHSKQVSNEPTEPISHHSNTSTEKRMQVYLEGSTKSGCLNNPPITSTADPLRGSNISYGFDPGGRDSNTSGIQFFSKSLQQQITNDKVSIMTTSSGINQHLGVLRHEALNNATLVQNKIKISNRIDQWIFRSYITAKTLFTLGPKRTNSQIYKHVEGEDGNMFRWHFINNSGNYANPLESSTATISVGSNYTSYYTERNVTNIHQETKYRIKNIFNLKRSQKITNLTTNYPIFGSGKVFVTLNLNFTTPQLNNVENKSKESISISTTPKCNYKVRGTYTRVQIYKPFEKVIGDKKFTIKTEEFHTNPVIKDLNNTVNKSTILHDDYADYVHSNKKHGLEIINRDINNTSNNTDTSSGILEFVFRPFSFLVNEFKSNSSKENESDYIPDGIKNVSIPNPLNLNSSLVVIAAVNNRTSSSSAEEVHDSKVGWLDMLGGWFHCVVESYSEPKPEDIHFYLYTRNNSHDPEELLLPEQSSTYENSTTEVPEPVFEQESSPKPAKKKKEVDEDYTSFEPLNPVKSEVESKWFNVLSETKILIHGYVQDAHTNIMVNMKDAYLMKGAYNVIVLDWSAIGDNSCYPMVATRALRGVGTLLARFLDRLVEGGVSLRKVHVVGFSLGAHVAGHAGTDLRSGLVSRITGLDPALPYVPMEADVSLDAGDAVFVDIIHSAAGYLGQPGPMGHVDFYPNGGSQQPGCDISSLGTCSHRRSALYFIESITSETGFPGTSCDSWHAFLTGRCANNTRRLMGEPCPADSSGKFYLTTGPKEPFAQQVEEHAKFKKSLLLDLFYDDDV